MSPELDTSYGCMCFQAKKKGANATVAGMIIAIYQLACMLVTPVFGYYVSSVLFLATGIAFNNSKILLIKTMISG